MSIVCNAIPSGVQFPATGGCDPYLSLTKHRPTSKGPGNKWAASVLPRDEYSIFSRSFVNGWQDDSGHLWGVEQDLVAFGSNGECLAKFPRRSNVHDPWHGYPVSATDPKRSREHRPAPSLVRCWIDADVISKPQGARIRRGKV